MNQNNNIAWLSSRQEGPALIIHILGAVIVGAVVLGLLCSVPHRYRKWVVMAVTFISGLFFSLEFLIPINNPLKSLVPTRNFLTAARPILTNWAIVVGSFAVLLGIYNLFQIHGRAVVKRTSGWYNSAAFFIAFFSILIAGFLKDSSRGASASTSSHIYDILFLGFFTSLGATMFSLIAFYIVSAAYRAFRIRSVESGLMMIAAAIVMLALVPIGAMITNWLPETGVLSGLRLERIGYWILVSPNMAVQRAIGFGVAVGALATGLRIWLSLERGSFFDRQL